MLKGVRLSDKKIKRIVMERRKELCQTFIKEH